MLPYHLGLRPKPPAAASGDGFITSGLRPEPPAAASGDPFAPRRVRRGACVRLGGRLLQCASGSGRTWNLKTGATFSVPPSAWNGARLPDVVQTARPFQPAAGSSMRPSSPFA